MTTVPPVSRTVLVRCTPADAFALFTDDIGGWWPLATHGVLEHEAAGVSFDGGRIVETAPSLAPEVWGEVLTWEPPDLLAFTWHPGRPGTERTQVTVTFRAEGGGTRVALDHVGWEILGETASEIRAGYDGADGWTLVLDRFADHAAAHSTG